MPSWWRASAVLWAPPLKPVETPLRSSLYAKLVACFCSALGTPIEASHETPLRSSPFAKLVAGFCSALGTPVEASRDTIEVVSVCQTGGRLLQCSGHSR